MTFEVWAERPRARKQAKTWRWWAFFGLTIKNFDTRFSLYTLGYPNLEVENGFLQSLSQFYIPAAASPLL